MKLLVYILGNPKRRSRVIVACAVATGLAIEFLGAPPVLLFAVPFGGVLLTQKTGDWMRDHGQGSIW